MLFRSSSEDELDFLNDPQTSQVSPDELIDVVGDSPAEPVPESMEPTVNQSVILIEEADILYQTDTSFWPALINIIKHCRRPVVLTCNGQCFLSTLPEAVLSVVAPVRCLPNPSCRPAAAGDARLPRVPSAARDLVPAGALRRGGRAGAPSRYLVCC